MSKTLTIVLLLLGLGLVVHGYMQVSGFEFPFPFATNPSTVKIITFPEDGATYSELSSVYVIDNTLLVIAVAYKDDVVDTTFLTQDAEVPTRWSAELPTPVTVEGSHDFRFVVYVKAWFSYEVTGTYHIESWLEYLPYIEIAGGAALILAGGISAKRGG